MRSPLLFRDSALPAPIRFIAGGLLLSLVLAGTLSIVGLERESSGQVSLVRVPDDANQNRPVVADLSGRWTGTIQTKTASTRIYLMLHQNGQSLLGTAGPDSDHQSLIHNMKLVNGTLNFSIGPSSEIHLNLEDDHLVGEIVEVNDVRPNVVLPDETAGFDDIVQKLISAFDETDILALADGHGRKFDSDLRIQVVRHPEFAKKVRFIVIEFGNTADQPILDRYIQGEDVPETDLQTVWTNTMAMARAGNNVFARPMYADFLTAVRDVNKNLPIDKRIRVLAGDPPAETSTAIDDRPMWYRDTSPASVLKEQVLDKGGKALVVYGDGHVYRDSGITRLLQSTHPGRIFVVDILGGPYPEYEKFEGVLKSSLRPVLVSLRRMPFRDFNAEEFLARNLTFIFHGVRYPSYAPDLTLGDLADACVYLGIAPDATERVQ